MAEYIEKGQALYAVDLAIELNDIEYLKVKEQMRKFPAADVVEVVRCKDCRCYNKPRLGWCNFHMDIENPNDYCSRGERKAYADNQ